MACGVFVHRSDSIYDDSPAERYQFPGQYLSRVRACVDDWIIYYEPRKVADTRGYFGVAKVTAVVPDPTAPGMYIAVIDKYLPFTNAVPFKGPDGVVEQSLLNEAGRLSGRAQSAVRPISLAAFNRIVELGLPYDAISPPRLGSVSEKPGLQEAPVLFEYERDRMSYFGSRIIRDRVFRQAVLQAYDSRCAVSGLRLINGGGRAEVEAAHIRPVAASGSDIVNNGLALSGTAHWMFDRGLIGIDDELRILVSRKVNDTAGVRGMVNNSGSILPPHRASDRPHPHFLRWHRENCFEV